MGNQTVLVIPKPVDVVFKGCDGYSYYYMHKNTDIWTCLDVYGFKEKHQMLVDNVQGRQGNWLINTSLCISLNRWQLD